VGFRDEHNINGIRSEKGAELFHVVEEAVGVPYGEAKGVGRYRSLVSTEVRRSKRVPIWLQSCVIIILRSWLSVVGESGWAGWGAGGRAEGREWIERRLGRRICQEWCGWCG
jgi:hypothetical protein